MDTEMTQPKLPEDLSTHQKLCDAAYQAGAIAYKSEGPTSFVRWVTSYAPPGLLPANVSECWGSNGTRSSSPSCRLAFLLSDCFNSGVVDAGHEEEAEWEKQAKAYDAEDSTGIIVGSGVAIAVLIGLFYLSTKRI